MAISRYPAKATPCDGIVQWTRALRHKKARLSATVAPYLALAHGPQRLDRVDDDFHPRATSPSPVLCATLLVGSYGTYKSLAIAYASLAISYHHRYTFSHNSAKGQQQYMHLSLLLQRPTEPAHPTAVNSQHLVVSVVACVVCGAACLYGRFLLLECLLTTQSMWFMQNDAWYSGVGGLAEFF